VGHLRLIVFEPESRPSAQAGRVEVPVATILGVPTGVDVRIDSHAEDRGLGPQSDRHAQRSLYGGVWWVALALVALELGVSARYGFHRDELYFIISGQHPAFGYVDQPPLAPLVTRLGTTLFGTNPTAVRVVPSLMGGAVVVGTGLTAGALGGRRFAQLLGAIAMACAPIVLGSAHLAGTTIYDLAAWTFTMLFVLRAVLLGRPRSWLAAGAVAGLGLENKDLILLLGVALAIGLLTTSNRSELATRWPWFGGLVALVLWTPNLVWQLTNSIPALAMARSLRIEHSGSGDYVSFIFAQVVLVGILAFPIAVVGIRHLMHSRELHFAMVALIAVVVYVFAVIPGRPYYTAGMLPLLFSAGGCRIEQSQSNRTNRRLWLIAPAVGAVLTATFALPFLPLSAFARMTFLHKASYDLGETVGWPTLTSQVADVYDKIPLHERKETAIFTSNYGEAGALAVYGRSYGLPEPLSGHNTYWIWGPGDAPDRAVVAVGSAEQLRPHFATCRYRTTIHSLDHVDNDENGTNIWICTGPRGTWSSFWSDLRHYG
jgi:4-amino-4-deoxy-L-arabinose transferase-like glycosyltransferase